MLQIIVPVSADLFARPSLVPRTEGASRARGRSLTRQPFQGQPLPRQPFQGQLRSSSTRQPLKGQGVLRRVLRGSFLDYAESRTRPGGSSSSASSTPLVCSTASSRSSTNRGQNASSSASSNPPEGPRACSSVSTPRGQKSSLVIPTASSLSISVSTMPQEAIVIASNSISNKTRQQYNILFEKFVIYGSKLDKNVREFFLNFQISILIF